MYHNSYLMHVQFTPDHDSDRVQVSTVVHSASKDGHGRGDSEGTSNGPKPYKWFVEKYTSFSIYFKAGITYPLDLNEYSVQPFLHDNSSTIAKLQRIIVCDMFSDFESQITVAAASVQARKIFQLFMDAPLVS